MTRAKARPRMQSNRLWRRRSPVSWISFLLSTMRSAARSFLMTPGRFFLKEIPLPCSRALVTGRAIRLTSRKPSHTATEIPRCAIQNRRRRCPSSGMKRIGHLRPKQVLSVSWLLLAALLPVALTWSKPPLDPRARDVGNNPDHFFLWSTNSKYSYRFIYDPLAADIWLCESGGRGAGVR
jgi:hypothetical protein